MYYIYHIEGIKIGCSNTIKRRIREQGFNQYEILEKHNDIHIASKREIELQKEYGYKVDTTPYYITYELNKLRRNKLTNKILIEAGKKAGNRNVETGWIKEFQDRSVIARTGTKHSDDTKLKMRIKAIGRESSRKTPILVYDKNDKFISEFESQHSASEKLGLRQPNISSVLTGKLKTTGGYKIKYKV